MNKQMRQKLGPGFDETFVQQWKHFEVQFEELLANYEGQFVAMRNGHVLDHDKDDEALAQRMFEKLGSKRFIIGEVAREPRVYEVPSVELQCSKRVRTTKV